MTGTTAQIQILPALPAFVPGLHLVHASGYPGNPNVLCYRRTCEEALRLVKFMADRHVYERIGHQHSVARIDVYDSNGQLRIKEGSLA